MKNTETTESLEYQEALSAARKCLALMKTSGWEIDVHENLGWFWKLTKAGGKLTVSGPQPAYKTIGPRLYHAMLSETGSGCTAAYYDNKRFPDPNKAVTHRIDLARRYANKTLNLIEEVYADE